MAVPTSSTVDRDRLARLMTAELDRFARAHPRSGKLHEQAKASLLDGVPMNWMSEWASPFPLFVDEASGVPRDEPDGRADDAGARHDDDTDDQRDTSAKKDPARDVAAERVGAKPMLR